MGANSSRAEADEDRSANYIKRQIGKRSSVNILKRVDTRTASTSAFPATSAPPQYDGSLDTTLDEIRAEASLCTNSDKSDASTVVRRYSGISLAISTSSSSLSHRGVDTVPHNAGHNKDAISMADETNNTQTSLSMTDETNNTHASLCLASPSLLLSTWIPDATISFADVSPPKPYTPRQSNLSPVELFRRARQRQHIHSDEFDNENNPQIARLIRKPYPDNLFRDPDPASTPGRRTRVAIALPLTPSQRDCHKQHDKLFATRQGSAPVECAICTCAGDCVDDEDGDLFWMCEWCAIRICGECAKNYREHGLKALMARSERDEIMSESEGSASVLEEDA